MCSMTAMASRLSTGLTPAAKTASRPLPTASKAAANSRSITADSMSPQYLWGVTHIFRRPAIEAIEESGRARVGPKPAPDPAQLRRRLDANGEKGTPVSLELVPEQRVELPAR